MASSREEGGPEANSTSESPGTPGTPGTPGSNDSDVPEEFLAFRDLICPELFRENVPRNTSRLQGAEWIAEIMTTPHQGRFYDNIRMTKPCFYALVDALTSRGLLPHGQTSRDCIGAMDGTLVPAWVPRVDQNRYRSRKGGLAQNVLAICDFDMNFTYVYAGWKEVRPMLGSWTMRVEVMVRVVHLITMHIENAAIHVDDRGRQHTSAHERRRNCGGTDGSLARGLRRHFGYPYTRDQYYPLASRYYQYPEPHYPSMLEVWGPIRLPGVPVEDQGAAEDNESINLLRSPVRGGVDAPIVISDSAAPSVQTHTHIASWDAVEHVARGDGGPQMHTVLHSPHDAVPTWARK
ncbi:UNVERIFIED_CONTAM: hypothetical protein Scaly_0871000 [Sesamum calycinum]|uniref:DUF8040 domain-containing protein n=1 Tax=Sesamum calycinum TaxID=2727403 RepID=A0AAW2QW07_9LAMI